MRVLLSPLVLVSVFRLVDVRVAVSFVSTLSCQCHWQWNRATMDQDWQKSTEVSQVRSQYYHNQRRNSNHWAMVRRWSAREGIYLDFMNGTFASFGVDWRFHSGLVGLLLDVVDEYRLLKSTEIISEETQTNNTFAILCFILKRRDTSIRSARQTDLITSGVSWLVCKASAGNVSKG